MSTEQFPPEEDFPPRSITRAEFLRRGAIVSAGALAFPLISACGSSGSKTASSTGAASAGSKTLSAADIATIKKYMGPLDTKFAGAGETWKIAPAPRCTDLAAQCETGRRVA